MVKLQVYDAVFEKKFHAVSKNLTLNLRDPGCKGTAVTMDSGPKIFYRFDLVGQPKWNLDTDQYVDGRFRRFRLNQDRWNDSCEPTLHVIRVVSDQWLIKWKENAAYSK